MKEEKAKSEKMSKCKYIDSNSVHPSIAENNCH
jgi:hypothetical protein